jgi:hypothetical protein
MATYPPTVNQLPSIFNPDDFYKPQTGVGTLQEVLIQGNDANNLDIVNGGTFGCDALSTPFGFINSLDASVLGDISTTGLSINPNGTLKIKGATTKGSLLVGDGTNTIELPTATNGLFLKTNSGTTSGLEWGSGGGGVSSITAGLNIGVDATIPSAPVVRVLNPLTSTLNLGTQAITGTTGYINFATASPSSEAQMSASIGFTAYDSITTGITTTLQKTGLTTQTTTDNINFTPTGITKSVGATTLGITSNTSNITLTPQTGKDCDVVVSGAGKLHIQQSTTGGQANPLCRLSNTNATGSVAMEVYKNKPTAVANGDVLFNQSVYGNDSGLAKQEYTRITHTIRDGTAGGEDGSIEFGCFVNNAFSNFLQINGNENEVNCLKNLDMGGNNIITKTGDLDISTTSSAGTGNIGVYAKGGCDIIGNGGATITGGTFPNESGAIFTSGILLTSNSADISMTAKQFDFTTQPTAPATAFSALYLDSGGGVEINCDATLKLTGTNLTSATAGGASGSFLNITINGTVYKLQLLNP